MSNEKLIRFNDGILLISEEDLEVALQQHKQEFSEQVVQSYYLQHPDGQPVHSMRRFFDAAQHSLPIAHSVKYSIGLYWSALEDVLWQGFEGLEIEWVDIVWKDADIVAEKSLPTLIHGLVLLRRTLESVQKEFGARHNLRSRIILTSKKREMFNDWFIER